MKDTQEPKKDYCTNFPEYAFGLPLWKYCKKHDESYEGSAWDKFVGDIVLFTSVMSRGIKKLLQGIFIMIMSVGMLGAVLTVGWYFWFKAKK